MKATQFWARCWLGMLVGAALLALGIEMGYEQQIMRGIAVFTAGCLIWVFALLVHLAIFGEASDPRD